MKTFFAAAFVISAAICTAGTVSAAPLTTSDVGGVQRGGTELFGEISSSGGPIEHEAFRRRRPRRASPKTPFPGQLVVIPYPNVPRAKDKKKPKGK